MDKTFSIRRVRGYGRLCDGLATIDNMNESLKIVDNECWNNLRWVIFTARGAEMFWWLKDASSMGSRGVILVTRDAAILEMVIPEAQGAEIFWWSEKWWSSVVEQLFSSHLKMLHDTCFPPLFSENERLLYAKLNLHKTFLNQQIYNRLTKTCWVPPVLMFASTWFRRSS